MATLSIEMSDGTCDRVCAAFAATYQRPDEYEGEDFDWVKACVQSFVSEVTSAFETKAAVEAARAAAEATSTVVLS